VLGEVPTILEKLQTYKGCEDSIRKAITTPNETNEQEAWDAVLPAVEQLKEFYDFSLELEKCFPRLLSALCKDDPKEMLAKRQALVKQIAEVFDFVLRFDDLKMVNPAIQNDFSYYRRTLNRMKLSKKNMDIIIKDELANRMSLFFAYPTPMMNVINDTTAKFLQPSNPISSDNVTAALQIMANVCEEMVRENKFQSADTNMFCLRCMVGAIILFDHVDPIGAFSKRSPINMRGCITAIKSFDGFPTDGLLNTLRFTSVHLNDPETPAYLKSSLD
jgi:CYRIA/CYRIB Rac1 binding domain